MQTAHSAVTIDNAEARVTTWTFQPGERTGTHTHQLPYVVVPVTGGSMRLETSDGTTTAEQVPGQPYFRPAGAEHDVVNAGTAPLVFVEIEVKS
jgi:beta-alanine degradation protein BauB